MKNFKTRFSTKSFFNTHFKLLYNYYTYLMAQEKAPLNTQRASFIEDLL